MTDGEIREWLQTLKSGDVIKNDKFVFLVVEDRTKDHNHIVIFTETTGVLYYSNCVPCQAGPHNGKLQVIGNITEALRGAL